MPLTRVIDLIGRHTRLDEFLPDLAGCLRTVADFDLLGIVLPPRRMEDRAPVRRPARIVRAGTGEGGSFGCGSAARQGASRGGRRGPGPGDRPGPARRGQRVPRRRRGAAWARRAVRVSPAARDGARTGRTDRIRVVARGDVQPVRHRVPATRRAPGGGGDRQPAPSRGGARARARAAGGARIPAHAPRADERGRHDTRPPLAACGNRAAHAARGPARCRQPVPGAGRGPSSGCTRSVRVVAWTDELAALIRPETEPVATWLAGRQPVAFDVERFDWTGREPIRRNLDANSAKRVCLVPLATPRGRLGFLVLDRRTPTPVDPGGGGPHLSGRGADRDRDRERARVRRDRRPEGPPLPREHLPRRGDPGTRSTSERSSARAGR